MQNFCIRYCTVREKQHETFLTADEWRKAKQRKPQIRLLYKVEYKPGDGYRDALRNIRCINQMINLL